MMEQAVSHQKPRKQLYLQIALPCDESMIMINI